MTERDPLEKLQEACRTNLFFLCTEMLGYRDWDLVHDDLEIFLNRPSAKKALLMPRGHLKTSIVTIGRTIQKILLNPNIRILIANQVWDRARDMASEIQGHLEMSPLPKVFGRFRHEYRLWNKDGFTIAQRTISKKEPTLFTTGVEAETTGGHYDFIILDDLMGHQNCQTPEQREKVKRFRRSMINLLEPDGEIIEVGTRWHLDDPFSELLEKEKEYYDVSVRKIVENGKIIFPKKFNKRFDPVRKDWVQVPESCMDFINYLKSSMTPAEFSSQYLNEPVDEENQLFKPAYFKTYSERPQRLFVSMTIDPAISEKRAADYFAINVSGMDENHNIYVLDTIKGHWPLSEQINNIFTTYLKWKPSVIGLETVAYQMALKHYLEEKMRERNIYFPITELRRNTNENKEFRIKALEPYYRSGMVYHAPWMKNLELELLTFPKGKHDDECDALASQLELLVAGDSVRDDAIPSGCWQEAFNEAQKLRQPYRSFFHEVANG